MSTSTNYTPNWISSPGETISDILIERKISIDELKNLLDMSEFKITQLITGKLLINEYIAERLSNVLGASQSFWLEREKQYREALQHINMELDSAQNSWLENLPTREMQKQEWLPKTIYKFQKFLYCLDFFGVQSISEWELKYKNFHSSVAFKSSQSFSSTQGSLDVWIRQGEIASKNIKCASWNKDAFISLLPEIRLLTRKKSPSDFLPKIQEICAACGVAVVIVKAPNGCRASGATKFITKNKAMIILSFPHLSDDHFWFTFFHEMGHLILHDSNLIFIDDDSLNINSQLEDEANEFAQNTLVPREYEQELYRISNNGKEILYFARRIGIAPGIVVGQLQKKSIIPYNHLNNLKTKFKWS